MNNEVLTLKITREALFALVDLWNINGVGRDTPGYHETLRLAVREQENNEVILETTSYAKPHRPTGLDV